MALLDRDGVLNVDTGYTHRPEDLEFVPGAPAAVRRLNESGRLVVVVTNQSGVGLGYYNKAQLSLFHAAMSAALAEHGALDRGLKIRTLTLPDIFQDHDKPELQYAQAGLDAEGIARSVLLALGVDNVSAAGLRA